MTSTSGIIDSIIDLSAATTNLAIDQMENVFTAFSRPGAAIDHVTDTMQNLSAAMNTSTAKHKATKHAEAHHEAAEQKHSATEHKHAATEHKHAATEHKPAHKATEHKAKSHSGKTHTVKA